MTRLLEQSLHFLASGSRLLTVQRVQDILEHSRRSQNFDSNDLTFLIHLNIDAWDNLSEFRFYTLMGH